MVVRLGADGTGSNVSALKSLGATFISRYTSEQSWALTPSEAKTLSNASIDIVSNYEHYTTDYAGGYNQGVTNAKTAWAVHKKCGGPDGRPIYFSVDTDLDPSNSLLHSYFQGACSVLTAKQVGVYGSTAICNTLKSLGLVTWTWRTMSTGWRGGAGAVSDFNVEQTGYFNSTYDRDAAITTDFGQWRVGVTPPNTPPPPPPVPGIPAISLAHIVMHAKEDPTNVATGASTDYAEIYPVQVALEKFGSLDAASKVWTRGQFGSMTVAAYSKWQQHLGFTGSNADGIPGLTSLTKLGQQSGVFTVVS